MTLSAQLKSAQPADPALDPAVASMIATRGDVRDIRLSLRRHLAASLSSLSHKYSIMWGWGPLTRSLRLAASRLPLSRLPAGPSCVLTRSGCRRRGVNSIIMLSADVSARAVPAPAWPGSTTRGGQT